MKGISLMKITMKLRAAIFMFCILFLIASCANGPENQNMSASGEKSGDITAPDAIKNDSNLTDEQTADSSLAQNSGANENPPENNLRLSEPAYANFSSLSLKNPADIPFAPITFKPEIKPYSIAPDLSNIENIENFPNLTENQKDALLKNHFFVIPSKYQQFSYLYDNNLYTNTPSFITTDSVLHVYKLFFDYSLRNIEEESLLPILKELTANMLQKSVDEYYAYPELSEEMERIAAYFIVPASLLGIRPPGNTPQGSLDLAQRELELIEAANGYGKSPITGETVLYENFLIRGHYTRSEKLSAYFTPMMWYGTVYFPIYNEEGTINFSGCVSSFLMAHILFQLPQESGYGLWEAIYSPTAFYTGESDDVTPFEMYGALYEVLGEPFSPPMLLNADLSQFYKAAELLRKPRIEGKFSASVSMYTGLQFRFMGQRYIPDSQILQNLSEPIVRPFPSGLDIFAVLGSERAREIIEATENPAALWPEYTQNFKKEKEYFTSLDEGSWKSNMYLGLMWTLSGFTKTYGGGWPYFMQSAAWQDKSLATGLSSWAQLRHDTILYGKASGAQMGGWLNENMGYVEPNIEIYERLLWLTNFSGENLKARGMLSENLERKAEQLKEMLERLINISLLELSGLPISENDLNWIMYYGGTLENISVSISTNGEASRWFEVTLDADRNMALIADVHNSDKAFLEAGVGYAAEIYVAVPYQEKLYLTRGAVYDYYEFVSANKLTDEAWQSLIETENAPKRPEWVKNFILEE